MRPIKFRAFVGGKMLPVGAIEFFKDGTLRVQCGGDWFPIGEQWGNFLMEWTGLLDRLGQDIYEGDIIRIQSQYETDAPVDSRATVMFSDGSFRCDFHNMILNGKVCSGSEGNWNCEVIGNIYENPKLLKDASDAPQG